MIREGFESQEMSESMSELISKYMSALESERINKIYSDFIIFDSFNSSDVSRCLVVEMKTASRLLNKAEKIGILESEGNTKNKRYKFKKFNL